jgi:hypothetical protein
MRELQRCIHHACDMEGVSAVLDAVADYCDAQGRKLDATRTTTPDAAKRWRAIGAALRAVPRPAEQDDDD